MIEIHFYKETELKYSVYANNIEDVIEAPASYYAEYTIDMTISAVKYINPVLDNGNLREATREELVAKGVEVVLEAGEIIENKKLVNIPQPSQYHEWNGSEWVVNLEEVKASKREELKRTRTKKIDENIEVYGSLFQVREQDLQNFYNLKIAVDLNEELATEKTPWVLADNTIKEFSYSALMGVLTAYIFRKSRVFTIFGELSMQLEACQSVEEIEAIKWE